jgi:DNA-binding NtrC family response regulator
MTLTIIYLLLLIITSVLALINYIKYNKLKASIIRTEKKIEKHRVVKGKPIVLILEDDELVQDLYKSLLHNIDVEVIITPSLMYALEILEKKLDSIELVISDIKLENEENGIYLIDYLKEHYPNIPLLVVSGFVQEIGKLRAKNVRVLTKPVSREVLEAEIKSILGSNKFLKEDEIG